MTSLKETSKDLAIPALPTEALSIGSEQAQVRRDHGPGCPLACESQPLPRATCL